MRNNRRSLARTRLENASLYAERQTDEGLAFVRIGSVWDINEDALLVYTHEQAFPPEARVKIVATVNCSRAKTKSALCTARYYGAVDQMSGREPFGYVLKYVPASSLDYYTVHQYFIRASIVQS